MANRCRLLIAFCLLAMAAQNGAAQQGPGASGAAPYGYQPPHRNEPGRFDYYALVLSWSPTYCDALPRDGSDPQCHRRDGRRYAFVLHGLWPQHERGWPEHCPTGERPFVPRPIIDSMLDIMPSPRLVIHEYRKHGTCSGLSPEAYYELSRRLFSKVTLPQRFVDPAKPFFVAPAELAQEFVEANAGLAREMVSVTCSRPGDRLKEVRVCFTREGSFRACGANEAPRRLCSAQRMYVPPVREGPAASGGAPALPPRSRAPQGFPEQRPLPGPGDPSRPARGEQRL